MYRDIVVLGFLLFACQVIPSRSSSDTVGNEASTSSNQPATTLPEGYVTFSDVNASYKIHKEALPWEEARERCASEGARLAIADTVDKIVHINGMKVDWGLQLLHVGIYQSNTTKEWVRIDNGLPVNTMPWSKGQPFDIGECAGISPNENGLEDGPCVFIQEYFVCEIPM